MKGLNVRYTTGHKEEARARMVSAAGRGFRRKGYGGIGVDGLAIGEKRTCELGMSSPCRASRRKCSVETTTPKRHSKPRLPASSLLSLAAFKVNRSKIARRARLGAAVDPFGWRNYGACGRRQDRQCCDCRGLPVSRVGDCKPILTTVQRSTNAALHLSLFHHHLRTLPAGWSCI